MGSHGLWGRVECREILREARRHRNEGGAYSIGLSHQKVLLDGIGVLFGFAIKVVVFLRL